MVQSVHNVCVCRPLSVLYSVLRALTSVLAGVCELATNKVIGEVLCNAPGPLGLLSMHELSTQVLRQYTTMLCFAPVLCFHADKDVLSSLGLKICFVSMTQRPK